MNAITYKNTKTTLPSWDKNIHEVQERGVAYETATHFVHFYCLNLGWNTLSPGLTVTEKKNGDLVDWVVTTFGAIDILEVRNVVGETKRGVWRPGLTMESDLLQGLENESARKHNDLVALRLLLSALDRIFEFVEPVGDGLKSYGHRPRELLISACTELENQWKRYINESNCKREDSKYTTQDYVKLCSALSLKEYRVTARAYGTLPPLQPFLDWDEERPSQSLTWYNAYNKTKHDRAGHFDQANVENCISAVVANVVLFCVRYGPNSLFNEVGGTQTLFQQMFAVELINFDSTTYYVPMLEFPVEQRDDLICYDSFQAGNYQQWSVKDLTL